MDNKRDQLLAVATKLFAERGFDNTSVNQICKEAGISKGLVYHHFQNKNDLLRAIFSSTTERMIEMSDSSESFSDPNKQLVHVIKQLFSQLRSDKLFFQLNLNIMLQPSTRDILHDLVRERSAHLLKSVQLIFDDIDQIQSEVLSYMFIAELDGIALDYLTVFDNYPIDKLEKLLIKKYAK